ncbi:HutD/Ves family protein [Xanthomonas arboricola]|uniref:HutD/Ves family protein n=1 Tax=Xanthomonas arboricola TaxID=56448 RepID=UPI00187BAC4F|nr:HutD family protein [Xanthomonas arboricola]
MQPTDLSSRVIPATEYRRERWRNQLGWTREILRLGDAQQWALRLSIAEIEQDAAFSAFLGIDRELVLLRGNGMHLHFGANPAPSGRRVELLPPYQRVRFAGEEAVRAVLLDGPTQDFNLMWRRDLLQAELLHRPLVGTMVFFADPGSAWAIHLLAGQASFGRESGLPALAAGDTAWLSASTRTRYVLDGGGELLAIRVSAADGA